MASDPSNSIQVYRYRIPFRDPFRTQKAEYLYREGLYFISRWNEQLIISEAAPLPDYSSEQLAELELLWERHQHFLQKLWQSDGSYSEWHQELERFGFPPSFRFGLDSLFLDRAARKQELPLYRYLDENATPELPVNAVVGKAPSDQILPRIQSLLDHGFSTFKLKVGGDPDEETELLQTIRDEFPNITLRLDANQAWPQAVARSVLQQWAYLEIEYCEEPLSNNNRASYRLLKDAISTPLAWDESIQNIAETKQAIDDKLLDVLIIKPMMVGSYHAVKELTAYAREAGCQVVFTSLLESAIGRWTTAHWASALASTDKAQGLATGDLLQMDIFDETTLRQPGQLTLPDRSGLGLPLSEWDPNNAPFELTKLN
jgi:o-succinylbenzoate synthase